MPEGIVRLACVRHAASVRSEPGSNSQVCVTKPRHEENPADRSIELREPIPALVKRNGYEGHVMASAYLNRYPEPEDPRTGRRRPHVPSSKLTMSKSRQTGTGGQRCLPGFWSGDLLSVYVGDRVENRSFEAASPSVERRIWGVRDSVNAFLQNYCTLFINRCFSMICFYPKSGVGPWRGESAAAQARPPARHTDSLPGGGRGQGMARRPSGRRESAGIQGTWAFRRSPWQ